MITLLAVVTILLLGSAFCSSSEAAIFSISDSKLESLSKGEKTNKKAILALKIKQNINQSIGSIVILNNIFNIVGTIIAGVVAASVFQDDQLWIGIFSAVLTFLVILFGEIIPKNLGEKFALQYILIIAPLVQILNLVLTPILFLIEQFTSLFFKQKNIEEKVSEEEIRVLLERGTKTRSIEYDEKNLIDNVFKMNDKTAKDVMTPRVNVEFLDVQKTLKEQKQIIYDSTHSRLPVFSEDYDQIVGFVLLREVLEEMAKNNSKITPKEVLQNVVKIKETTRVDSLLVIFQKKQTHLAVVIDEFGGTSGLVTLEDVIEEIVGEIVDETDDVVDMRQVEV